MNFPAVVLPHASRLASVLDSIPWVQVHRAGRALTPPGLVTLCSVPEGETETDSNAGEMGQGQNPRCSGGNTRALRKGHNTACCLPPPQWEAVKNMRLAEK